MYFENLSHPQEFSFIKKVYSLGAPARGEKNRCDVVPDGAVDLAFEITDSAVTPYLFGSSTKTYQFATKTDAQYFGVSFKPGFLPVFDDYVVADLIDTQIKLDHVHSLKGATADFLQAPSSFDTKQNFIYSFIKKSVLVRDSQYLSPIIRYMLENEGIVEMSEAFKLIDKSSRQIEREFKKNLGLSPIKLCRILRFHRALRLLRNGNSAVQVALDSGYFDQSHMINDFQQLSGKSPSRY